MARPDFLDLPVREAKPRRAGITHVLDRGMPLAELSGLLGVCAEHVDIWKLGWGTAYLDPQVAQRVAILREHEVAACVGGTLLEVAWVQGAADRLLDWAADTGFPCVEVSNGTQRLPILEKRRLIERAAARFTVLAEVGSKEADAPVHAYTWAEEAAGDLEAGATCVVAEGARAGPSASTRRTAPSAPTSSTRCSAPPGTGSSSRRRARTSRPGSSAGSAPRSTSATSSPPRCSGSRRCAWGCARTPSS